MARYGMDYRQNQMYGGRRSPMAYGAEVDTRQGGGWREPGGWNRYGGGMARGGMHYGSEYGGRGMGGGFGAQGGYRGGRSAEEPFRGRGQAYDTYFRRDFLTNQGDFSPEFGGGEEYGYRGMRRGGGGGGRFRGSEAGYDVGYRGGREAYGGSEGRGDVISYGPHFGERSASIQPEDIARRNFEGR